MQKQKNILGPDTALRRKAVTISGAVQEDSQEEVSNEMGFEG